MRRRHFSARILAGFLIALITPVGVSAQGGLAQDGALFLLLPVGARAVGMGQAVVADQTGSEAVWWNAAALARAEKREVAIHHSQSVIGTGDALTVVVPSSLLGVLALSANIFNYGELPLTGDEGSVLGSILTRSFVYAATYATSVGDHFGAGLSYKVLQFRVDCSGLCPSNFAFSGTTSAIDVGTQYDFGPWLPVVLGASVRNVGPRLQVNDNDQADPLPSRLQVGLLYRLPGVERYSKNTEVRLTGDLLDQLEVDRPSARFGADLVWEKRVHVRGGYVFDAGEAGGPSVGFGLVAGSLTLDIARLFEGLSADAGQAPTYLSLRYLF